MAEVNTLENNMSLLLNLSQVATNEDRKTIDNFVKTMLLKWDPDYTKLLPDERRNLQIADKEFEDGDFVDFEDVNWD